MVVDELADIQTDMAAATQPATPQPELPTAGVSDPARNSPKRAKWLADQAAEAERLKAPRSRRDLFGRPSPSTEA
jgi:hypothetical protein